MSVVMIGRFYRTEEQAAKGCMDMQKQYRRAFRVLCSKNGFLVITKAQADNLKKTYASK